MTSYRWIMNAVAALAAVWFAYYGVIVLWTILSIASVLIEQRAGGLGAVSAGVSEDLLVLIACFLANRLLARLVHRSGGVVWKLHRAHSITFLAAAVSLIVLILLAVMTRLSWPVPLTALFLLTGILFGVQFWLLSATLVAVMLRRPAVPEAG
jgi:hypothetical protein